MATALSRLQGWYDANTNGDWEHAYGLSISTLDNPGWSLSIDLEETVLEDVPFEEYRDEYESEREWLRCWKEEKTFQARCGPQRLESALEIFLAWAEAHAEQAV